MESTSRRFVLDRQIDVSGVSGLGIVAEGVQFSDGHCAVHWLGDWPTTTSHYSIESVIAVHGHEGKTKVAWLDD